MQTEAMIFKYGDTPSTHIGLSYRISPCYRISLCTHRFVVGHWTSPSLEVFSKLSNGLSTPEICTKGQEAEGRFCKLPSRDAAGSYE